MTDTALRCPRCGERSQPVPGAILRHRVRWDGDELAFQLHACTSCGEPLLTLGTDRGGDQELEIAWPPLRRTPFPLVPAALVKQAQLLLACYRERAWLAVVDHSVDLFRRVCHDHGVAGTAVQSLLDGMVRAGHLPASHHDWAVRIQFGTFRGEFPGKHRNLRRIHAQYAIEFVAAVTTCLYGVQAIERRALARLDRHPPRGHDDEAPDPS